MRIQRLAKVIVMTFSLLLIASGSVLAKDQLPSWNEGPRFCLLSSA